MKANIKTIDSLRLAGIMVKVDSEKGETDFSKYWTEFFKVLSTTGNLDGYRESFGYSKNYVEEGGRSLFDYLISMRVEDYRKIPEGFIEDVIPGGRYAVYTYMGEMTPERVKEFYNNIYYKWLAEDGLSPSRNECFEHYDSRFKEGSRKSEYDIWVPVV